MIDEMPIFVLLAQVASTMAMVGLIWFVQIVHYPLFAAVGSDEFPCYEESHQRRTTLVVVPLMLTELISAVGMLWWRPAAVGLNVVWFGAGLVLAIWLTTFIIQVPQHAALTRAFDPKTQRRLVLGNWIRTVLWSIRGALTLWFLYRTITAV